jgi:hypothetical protein
MTEDVTMWIAFGVLVTWVMLATIALLNVKARPTKAFVIANGDKSKFRCWGDFGPAWTEQRQSGLHFARRRDAVAFAKEDEDAWYILQVQLEGEA